MLIRNRSLKVVADLNDPLNITGVYNYFPYGSQIENRCYEAPANRFGFQGQQRDDELTGKGNTMNYEYRNYDAQTGIFKTIDPLAEKYAGVSPYAAFGLNPILYMDPDGRSYSIYVNHNTQSIEIKLIIHVTANDANVLNEAIQPWKDAISSYSYEFYDGSSYQEYSLNMDVETKEYNTESERITAFSADNSMEANSFEVKPPSLDNWGQTETQSYGKNVMLNKAWAENTSESQARFTPAHEYGHFLYLGHFIKGLMEQGSTRQSGVENNIIYPSYISRILNNGGIGNILENPNDKETTSIPQRATIKPEVKSEGTSPNGFEIGEIKKINDGD